MLILLVLVVGENLFLVGNGGILVFLFEDFIYIVVVVIDFR